ncbi:MAG: heavy-metal-associated domain-containing protein [Clostridia bacterium]|nr:heavy-metal-associated domain-containing protein [Clostridia bacterium]
MKKTLKIEGMMCQHCVAHVTKALQGVEGVASVDVNLKKKTATVELAQDVSDDTLTAVVTDAGYTVKKIS